MYEEREMVTDNPFNFIAYHEASFPIEAQFGDCSLETDFRNFGAPWLGVDWIASQVWGTLAKGEGWSPP